MRADFIPQFIGALIEIGKEIRDIWSWESLYYKGIRVKGYDRRKFYNGIKNLENRKLLYKHSNGRYGLTKKGHGWFSGRLLKFHKISHTQWDGKWRILIFDIPQELHNKRNLLRAKLKSLGFYMIQKSVFAFPYPCEKEVSAYANYLGIADYLDIITAYNLGIGEQAARKFFAL